MVRVRSTWCTHLQAPAKAGGVVSTGHSDSEEIFRRRYDCAGSEVARRVEREALGHEAGVNGYTTLAQAERLAQCLALTPESLLLDLGAGRGWPGTFLSAASRCRVVLMDVPIQALLSARVYAEDRGVAALTKAVCALGQALPFRPESFDAVVHADVLC